MKLKPMLTISSLGLAMLLAFNNCGQKMQFVTSAEKNVGANGAIDGDDGTSQDDPPTTPPPVTPDTPTSTIIESCKAAMAAGKLMTNKGIVNFADTKIETGRQQVCQFGVDNNLSAVNGTNRARYEQNKSINLPAGAVLCDVRIAIATQKITYDDVFLLTFNGRVLASNDKSALLQSHTPETNIAATNGMQVPLFKYDWMKFRDTPFQNNDADDYCFGSDQGLATCKWPLTQQTGDIVFDFAPELLIDIGKRSTSQTFSLIVTGDNDPNSDCYHSALEFNMEYDYYVP